MNCPRCDNSTLYYHHRTIYKGEVQKDIPFLRSVVCPKCNLLVYDTEETMKGYAQDFWAKIQAYKQGASEQGLIIPTNFWPQVGISLYYVDGSGTKDYNWRNYARICQEGIPLEDIDPDPEQEVPSERDLSLDPRGGEVDRNTDDIPEDGGVQSEVPILRHGTPEGEGDNPPVDTEGDTEISISPV